MWIVLAVLVIAIAVACAARVLLAKAIAIKNHSDEVSLLGGILKLVLWEANQGLVILKNKQVSELIYGPKDGGGTKFIYPLFGEEVRLRVPLSLKLTQFEDMNVLTRESIQLYIKLAIWWRVADLGKYYSSVDKQLHVMTDELVIDEPLQPQQKSPRVSQQNAAEVWILTLTESCTRRLVSQASVSQLISKYATSHLNVEDQLNRPRLAGSTNSNSRPEIGSPDLLAKQIKEMLVPKLNDYGLGVERIEVQELRLPQEIQTALDNVWKAALLPAQSEQEARARQIQLQASASVLGVEAVALSEVMKSMQGSQFIGGMPAFLETLFGALGEKSAKPLRLLEDKDDGVKCPKCGGKVRVSGDDRKAKCTECGAGFRIAKR